MKAIILLLAAICLLGCQDETNATILPEDEAKGMPVDMPAPEKKSLDVPLILQNPELRYGCEVTSTAMMLQYAGVSVGKMELYRQVEKDTTPLVKRNGNIIRWGDPQNGFIGDMTGKTPGYAVFDKPIEALVNRYVPALNLTGENFSAIIDHVGKGYPVVVWTTGDYKTPDRPESWKVGNKVLHTPLDLHAVVLVGYTKDLVYINDPLSGKKNVRVNRKQFEQTWKAMQSRAVSYNGTP